MNWGEPWYSALRTSQVNYRIENQRYFERNLMPGMLGWFKLENEYRPEEIEWIQARSAGFNAGYLLRVDETIERNGFKDELFLAIREWQRARRANAFSQAQRERFKDPKTEFHLSKRSETSWDLVPVTLHSGYDHQYRQVQTGEPVKSKFLVSNSDGSQPVQFYLTAAAVEGNKTATVSNIVIDVNEGETIEINETLKAGDKIFCDGKRIVLCDAYWKVVKEIGQGSVPTWKEGSNALSVVSEFADSQAPVLKLEFKTLGKAELVSTEK